MFNISSFVNKFASDQRRTCDEGAVTTRPRTTHSSERTSTPPVPEQTVGTLSLFIEEDFLAVHAGLCLTMGWFAET